MTLSPRRFPDTILPRRSAPGDRNAVGEYIEGAMVETAFRAAVQPIALTDADIAGAVGLVERFKIFVGEADALRAAFNDSVADRVLWGGETFTVVESRSWPGSHKRATILRAS